MYNANWVVLKGNTFTLIYIIMLLSLEYFLLKEINNGKSANQFGHSNQQRFVNNLE